MVKKSKKTLPDISFGAPVKSKPDYRDVTVRAALGTPEKLPTSYYVGFKGFDQVLADMWHQHKIGACTGHALGKRKQALEMKETGELIEISPRYNYAIAKELDGLAQEGTYPRIIMKTGTDNGYVTTDIVPNDTESLTHAQYIDISKYRKAADKAAAKYKDKSYAPVGLTKSELKQAIIEGDGVLMVIEVGEEWYTDTKGSGTWDEAKICPLRAPKAIISGHYIYLYGYEDDAAGKTTFYFINSWGNTWARKGVGYFCYEDYGVSNLREAWTNIDLPDNIKEDQKALPKPGAFTYAWTRDMEYGQTSDYIKKLQTALKIDGVFSIGQKETGYYGDITRQAVYDYGVKHKIATLTELKEVNGKRVGPKMRAALNAQFKA